MSFLLGSVPPSMQDLPLPAHQEPSPLHNPCFGALSCGHSHMTGHSHVTVLPFLFPWGLQVTNSNLGCLTTPGTFFCPPPPVLGMQICAPQKGSKEPGWHVGPLTGHIGCSLGKSSWVKVPVPDCALKAPVPFPLAP